MRVIGYTRVSTNEQEASIVAQHDALRTAAQERGWDLSIWKEVGSGKSMDERPVLETALESLRLHRADALAVSHLSRLSRSVLDFATLAQRSVKEGWAIIALDLGIDTSTPAGEFMATVVAAVAQYERRLIGQRTRDAMAVKKAQGVHCGRPKSIPPHLLTWMRYARAAGSSYQELADKLNARGIPTTRGGSEWRRNVIRDALK